MIAVHLPCGNQFRPFHLDRLLHEAMVLFYGTRIVPNRVPYVQGTVWGATDPTEPGEDCVGDRRVSRKGREGVVWDVTSFVTNHDAPWPAISMVDSRRHA
jgi:hypothetical protein